MRYYGSLNAYLDDQFHEGRRYSEEDRADFYEEEYKLERLEREKEHECGSTGDSDLTARGGSQSV